MTPPRPAGKPRQIKPLPILFLLMVLGAALCLLVPASQESSVMTAEEARISRTLSRIAGAGETTLSIYYSQASAAFGTATQTPAGAVIVSAGAGSLEVRLRLLQAAQSLLGLDAGRISVFPLEVPP